ncbi:MAG: hypothetical protein ABL859_01910 [Methylotenera sp.]|uniref:hypothetical protein n=1 Tax=Methyloglobulus sp. TaxID=2518622 RepID=UPI0032B7A3B3
MLYKSATREKATGWRELTAAECKQVSGGWWGLIGSSDDFAYAYTGHSEQLEDGTWAVWYSEDWEIYGPGSGSPGAYRTWQDDILSWLSNGSLLASDIIDWNSTSWSSSPTNFVMGLNTESRFAASGSPMVIVGGTAVPVGGVSIPGSSGLNAAGEIVVNATLMGWDQSTSYRLSFTDPNTGQMSSWVHNSSFVENARIVADGNVMVIDESALATPMTQAERDALALFDALRKEIIADLMNYYLQDPNSFFLLNDGRKITVSDYITLLQRADVKLFEDSYSWGNAGVGGTIYNNGDPVFEIRRSDFLSYANNADSRTFWLLHEATHITVDGRRAHMAMGNGDPLEWRTNDITYSIASLIGRTITDIAQFRPLTGAGYTPTTVSLVRQPPPVVQ